MEVLRRRIPPRTVSGAGFLNLSGSKVNLMESLEVDKWL